MTHLSFQVALFVLLALLFIQLARADLTQRCLPNRWVLCYALLFPVYALLREMTWMQLALHGLVGVITFIVLLWPFARGGIGGGDVKLATVVMLWSGPQMAATALVVASVSGALLGIIGWLADRWPNPTSAAQATLLQQLRYALSAQRGVPYGVALVAGGATALTLQGW